MDVQTVEGPAFFKCFLAESSAKELKIPSTFIQSIQEALPKNVALRDRYNNVWHVEAEKVGDDSYFKDGWIKVVEDNFIKSGDMLVFKYSCEGLFDVKILGPSACETKGVGGPLDKLTEEEDEDGDDTEDGDCVFVSRQENQHGIREEQVDAATEANPHESKRTIDWYGLEIFRSGLAPQPVNPYFVTKTRRNRLYELYVPVDVIKHYNLDLPEKILLVDPSGRNFHAKQKMWKDGRIFYTGGWKGLCKTNFVEQDDKIICEFMGGGGGELHLSISFVRANRHQG